LKMKQTIVPAGARIWKWASEASDLEAFDPVRARRILFEIYLINAFEHRLLDLKKADCVWGPVHTSVGQEGAAAAAVAALKTSDKFLATHRSHHQFLAKVLEFLLPRDWDPARDDVPAAADQAVRKTMAEIMGLAEGWCGGRGGSMHLRCAEAGFLGSNGIVGGGIPIATGAAFTEKAAGRGDIVLCAFGDGAVNQGSFHEALNLAGLWKLPIVYFLENNLYAVATSVREAAAVERLAIRASSYGMDAYVVDAADTIAVYGVVAEAARRSRRGEGPIFIEALCYRRYHHAGEKPGSVFGYRSREEEERMAAAEPIVKFPAELKSAGLMTDGQEARIRKIAEASVAAAVEACVVPGTPPRVRVEKYPRTETLYNGLRSPGREWEGIAFNEVEDFAATRSLKFGEAIAEVTGRWLEKDPRVFVLGEEMANLGGGAYGGTKGLPPKYPGRILNTPISEAGFTGLALGAAMTGMKPIVEIMFPDFTLVAADQIFNQIARARHQFGGTTDIPLVARTRIAVGSGYGAQHSMDPAGLYALFPGWRIVAPANSFDYIGLFNSAMVSLDPVLIMEHHSLYEMKSPVPEGTLDYFVPFGRAKVVAEGADATLIAYGAIANRCRAIAESLAAEGIRAEVIDLRTVDHPGIDYETIVRSVKKTGIAVVAEEAPESMSIGYAIAAGIMDRCFDYLDGPVVRLASADVPNPVSRPLERAALLSDERIRGAVRAAAGRSR
jgi:2-oxoisovalerate dehydrogenase E1 component